MSSLEEKIYSYKVEQTTLGCMIVDRSAAITAQATLSEEDFYAPEHKAIFKAIDNVINKDLDIDLPTVVDELVLAHELENVGDIDYLTSIIELAMNPSQIEQYIKILQDKTMIRKMIDFANELPELWNKDTSNSVEDFVADEEAKFLNITRNRKVGDFQSSKEVLDIMKAKMSDSARSSKGLTGVTSGFADLDSVTLGWQKGDLIILAARPSMGKTALALNFLVNAAAKEKRTVAIFSIEMPADQLMHRLVASRSGVDGHKIRSLSLNDRDSMKVDTAMNELASLKLFIDDKTSTVADIGVKARKLKSTHDDLGLIVIDYLQFAKMGGNRKFDGEQAEVAEMSKAIKALAKELEVPIILLSQLSRSVEKRDDKRPMLSDLRSSGSIEQDADIVLFIYREDYYKQKEVGDENDNNSIVELAIAKHRQGARGKVKLLFMKNIGLFSDFEGGVEDIE